MLSLSPTLEWGNHMKTLLIAGAALILGAAIGYFFSLRTIRTLRQRVRDLRAGREQAQTETMKRVVWACVINGFAWVWCSYILAALDRVQIAEEHSKVALAEIVVPVAVYALKSVVENLSKNNHWPDKAAAIGTDDITAPGQEGEEPPDVG